MCILIAPDILPEDILLYKKRLSLYQRKSFETYH